jgi:glycosyltransferase involved in cell wall biosynthesis
MREPAVMVGNWNHSDYSRDLYNRNKHRADVRMLKAIYDLDILYALRCNARIYVHGHRAGGTNPSLVEAMFSERPIVAFDVVYNRETTQGKAYYYSDAATLRALVARDDLDGSETTATARREYIWKDIARQYEEMMTESG